MFRFLPLSCLLAASFLTVSAHAQTNPIRVAPATMGLESFLFVGNSLAFQNRPEMTAQLSNAYTRAGNDNNELVIPAGLAFARVVRERPDLSLYQPGKRHPVLLGSYLAAATVYAALDQRSPEDSSYTAGMDPELARYLRKSAWRTAQEYYGASKQPAGAQ